MFNPKVPCNGVPALLFIFLKKHYSKPRDFQIGIKIYIYYSPANTPVPCTPCKHPTQKSQETAKNSLNSSGNMIEVFTLFFPYVALPESGRRRNRDLGQVGPSGEQGVSGTAWWQPPGRQKFRFSLAKCLLGPASLTELGITASWGGVSSGAFINTIS